MSINNDYYFIKTSVVNKLLNTSRDTTKETTRILNILDEQWSANIRIQGNNTQEQEVVRVVKSPLGDKKLLSKNKFVSEYCSQYDELKGQTKNYISHVCIIAGGIVFGLVLYGSLKVGGFGLSPIMIVGLILSGALLLGGVITLTVEARKICKYAEEAYQEYKAHSPKKPLSQEEEILAHTSQSETNPPQPPPTSCFFPLTIEKRGLGQGRKKDD